MKLSRVVIGKKTRKSQVSVRESRLTYLDRIFVGRRISGNFAQRAFYLNDTYDWVLGKDNKNCLVLIPLIRK